MFDVVIPNRTYTPDQGKAIVDLIRKNGYPKARLIGSLANGRESTKDIDILIPLRNKKLKQKCCRDMYELLKPYHMNPHMGWYQFGMITTEHGVLDFFFTEKYFTFGIINRIESDHFDIKDIVITIRGKRGQVVARKFYNDVLVKCLVKFDSGKCIWCSSFFLFHEPTDG